MQKTFKEAIKGQIKGLFHDGLNDKYYHRYKVFGFDKKYVESNNLWLNKNCANLMASKITDNIKDHDLAKTAVKFIIYDLIYGNDVEIKGDASVSWSGKILAAMPHDQAKEIKNTYDSLKNSQVVKKIKEKYFNNDLHQINYGITLDQIIKEVAQEPSLWTFIKHYVQVIYEYIRDYPQVLFGKKDKVEHEETQVDNYTKWKNIEGYGDFIKLKKDYEKAVESEIY